MKTIRNILLLFVLIFGMVLQAETYQNELWACDTAYYLSSQYKVADREKQDFLNDAQRVSRENNVSIFTAIMNDNSRYQRTLDIYGETDQIRDSLYDKMDIEETTYTSVISGKTTVRFHDFAKINDVRSPGSTYFISYIGESAAIEKTYETLAKDYNISEPFCRTSTEKDMMIVIWSMVAIIMVILNGIEVVRRKKEVVVRRSLGESAWVIIGKVALTDLISYLILFLLAKGLTSLFATGDYEKQLVLAIYIIGAALSLLPYLSFAAFDVRKAFANAADEKGIRRLMYGLKVLATALTIFTIATNLNTLRGNLYAGENILEPYGEANYLCVYSDGLTEGEEFWESVYEKEYDRINPVIFLSIWDLEQNYIFVNENAKGMLQGFTELAEKNEDNADVLIFIPEGENAEAYKIEAQRELRGISNNAGLVNVRFVDYSEMQNFSYPDVNKTGGLKRVKNPVVIYQTNDRLSISGHAINLLGGNNLMFQCEKDELEALCEDYKEALGEYSATITNVSEAYSYNHSFIVNLIRFLSSLCILVLILDIVVILSTNKLEYRVKALEISLKKVLGYSLYERHKKLILINLIGDGIAILVMCILSFMVNNLEIGTCIGVGLAITVVELFVICKNVLGIEKENVQKTLKGGCL